MSNVHQRDTTVSNEQTIDAVRLAMGMQELRAHVAGLNVANAGLQDARAQRVDFAAMQSALEAAAAGREVPLEHMIDEVARTRPTDAGTPIRLDEQVGEMVAAGLAYQALGEALSRHYGLMRLAVTGRS